MEGQQRCLRTSQLSICLIRCLVCSIFYYSALFNLQSFDNNAAHSLKFGFFDEENTENLSLPSNNGKLDSTEVEMERQQPDGMATTDAVETRSDIKLKEESDETKGEPVHPKVECLGFDESHQPVSPTESSAVENQTPDENLQATGKKVPDENLPATENKVRDEHLQATGKKVPEENLPAATKKTNEEGQVIDWNPVSSLSKSLIISEQ